jgi:ATP-dependent Clp protease ATP-binding subunit ClpB
MMEELRSFFRPEFLNRVDETIVFRSLSRDDILKIVDLQVAAVNERLSERNLSLRLTAAARNAFMEHGYSPDFGARPLKRLIQKWLLDPLARLVIEGAVGDGDAIQADWKGGAIALAKK